MKNFPISSNTIKVCVGAGCKAWKSTEILSLIWEKIIQARGAKKLRVCATPCMKRCGGGVVALMIFALKKCLTISLKIPKARVVGLKRSFSA